MSAIEFYHEHNHNPGFPGYLGYNVKVEINTGTGFTTLATFLASRTNNSKVQSITGPGLLAPGTYTLRWVPQLNSTGTDYFALDDIRLIGQASDADSDGVPDTSDNCPTIANPAQTNTDGDSLGDACDSDDDGDGVLDVNDAFPHDANESVDTDGDGVGNNADPDDDGDGDGDGV